MASANVAALDAVDITISGLELFRGLSLQVPPGKMTVLAGAGSAGKSTVLRVLWGSVRVASGVVTGGDRDLTRASLRRWSAWRRKIGIVCDDFPVMSEWMVSENLAAALRVAGKFSPAAMADRINGELRQWKLLNKRHLPAGKLSDGERARLALARAFVRNPIAAFLDEPLAKIPKSERSEMIGILKRKTLAGTGILAATSAEDDWVKAADAIYIAENGRLRRHERIREPLIA